MASDEQDNTPGSGPLRGSEQEQIRQLQDMGTNFIFLFGKLGVGKSSITASLLHYLSTECHYGNLEKRGNPEGQQMWEAIRRDFAGHRFPQRSNNETVYEVECIFVPSSNYAHLTKLPLTFLEMGGESLSRVSIMNSGELPSNIDIFFKAGNLSMLFVLVTSPQEAQQDDHLLVEFLDYINQKSPRYRDARALLLVAKWDEYRGLEGVDKFLKQNMPSTYRRLAKPTNAYGVFTVGTVEGNLGGRPYIHQYDSRPARNVFGWIYRTLTGKKLS